MGHILLGDADGGREQPHSAFPAIRRKREKDDEYPDESGVVDAAQDPDAKPPLFETVAETQQPELVELGSMCEDEEDLSEDLLQLEITPVPERVQPPSPERKPT
ncbi:hypothetical protein BBJ28_00027115 [Nothophytophthora sp. Chile5]|nr:hypothetical protein BBJ28_00027115 [Nothophytophthora sp. Chile5]